MFRSTTAEDAGRIGALLDSVFRLPQGHQLLDARLMSWKYWEPHPDWDGSRSFVIEDGGRFTGHIAAWPLRLLSPDGGIRRAMHIIDWAAEPDAAGVGLRLLKRVTKMTDATFVIGGSASTREILPVFGFESVHPTDILARPLHPFRQMLDHPRRDWRLPARLARNLLWRWFPAVPVEPGWRAQENAPDEQPERIWEMQPAAGAMPRPPARLWTPAVASYYLRCPVPRFRFFVVDKDGSARGFFLFSEVPGVTRLVALRTCDPADRSSVMRLAVATALRQGAGNEVTVSATLAGESRCYREAGFRPIDTQPTLIYPAAPAGAVPAFEFADSDAAILSPPRPGYLT